LAAREDDHLGFSLYGAFIALVDLNTRVKALRDAFRAGGRDPSGTT
jgi:hypothetical protein